MIAEHVLPTPQQQLVIDALQIVSGFESWRFVHAPGIDSLMVISNHDVEYELKADGTLYAKPLPDCDKCRGSGFVQKKGSFSMKSCDCEHGQREVTRVAKKYGY